MNITSAEIRQKYLDFFKSKNHSILESAPIVPENDPSVLFNTAGMQPLVPYLLGEKHPMGTRLADVQKCIRTTDIEEVGDNTHLTFFEMLGNWSLGDYFKEESIKMSYELLTDPKWFGIDKKYLAVTVFEGDENAPRDDFSAGVWKSLGMPENRVSYMGAKDNWWAAGPTGPCGPDTEIFYWVGEGEPNPDSNVKNDENNWMEIWNNVFMEFNRTKVNKTILVDGMHCLFDKDFKLNEEVYNKIILFGEKVIIITNAPKEKLKDIQKQTGFEVVTYENNPPKINPEYFKKMLTENKLKTEDCIYIDHLQENLDSAKQSGIKGELFENAESIKKLDKHFYILANLPAQNVDTGMGLERITRTLNKANSVYDTDIFTDIIAKIREIVGENYNERSARIIADHLRASVMMISDGVFPKNVDQGYILRRLIRRAIREFYKMNFEKPIISEIAKMYISKFENVYISVKNNKSKIIEELNKEEEKFSKTIKDGIKEFERLVKGFEIAFERSGQKITTISGDKAFRLYDTFGFPLEMTQELAKENGLEVDKEGFTKAFEKHQELSRTASEGKFKGGLAGGGEMETKYHTTTHLLLAGLRKVLGGDVFQAGSNITSERLRFDFKHGEKMTPEQLKLVEDFVNEVIQKNAKVEMKEMKKDEAKASGIVGSFWEKYPDIVKIYTITGTDGTIYSQELCGGPHIENTGTLGKFKITKEEASSSGVRRIKGVLE
ncbi:HAD-IA family hydrolase [Candidatus Gracilibacteria bacterium]|nr:HAD-IA family hydrolase [Candidatus Gracilibacteria bacterium]